MLYPAIALAGHKQHVMEASCGFPVCRDEPGSSHRRTSKRSRFDEPQAEEPHPAELMKGVCPSLMINVAGHVYLCQCPIRSC